MDRNSSRSAATNDDPPSLNTGVSVTIAIDSAADMSFWGRVTSWFAGDVGIAPARLGAVSGTVDLEDGVTVSITQPSHPAVTVMGEVRGDVIVVHECWTGANAGPFLVGDRFQRLH